MVPEDQRTRLPRDLNLPTLVALLPDLMIGRRVVLLLEQIIRVRPALQRVVLQLKGLPKTAVGARVDREPL